jgi:hypothetical protein
LDLFGRELLAVDGTRIKAVNNKDRNFTRASLAEFIKLADKKLDDYLQRLDQSDAAEQTVGGARVANLAEKIAAVRERRERCKAMLAELDRTGESQISLTDPDSRAMAAHTHVAVGYNVQVAVDTKHKLIVEQQVTNQVVDMGLLTQTAEPAKEILGVETIDAVADKGYFKIEDIEACEKAGIVPYVPRPQRGPSVKAGHFRKDEFSYDAETDSMICPAGQRLYPYIVADAWAEEDQLRQPCGLSRLSPAASMHGESVPLGVTAGERGGAGSDGRPAGAASRHSWPAAGGGRAPVWHDQTMDVSGRIPDAGSGEGSG